MHKRFKWVLGIVVCIGMMGVSLVGAINILIGQVEGVVFNSFLDVPNSFTRDPGVFTRLFSRADSEIIRIAMFGDSQETAPGGAGSIYVPRLNYEMFLRFGSASETIMVGYGSFGGGAPYGAWLLTGHGAGPGPSNTRVSSSRILPNITVKAHSTKNLASNINGQVYGQLSVLRQHGERLDPETGIDTELEYFCMGSSVMAEIFAATYPGSGEVSYYAKPTNSVSVGNFFESISVSGILSMGLDSNAFAIKSMITPNLTLNGLGFQQIELVGSDDSKLTDIVGVRYKSDQCSRGVVIHSFSAGGYTVASHINNHNDAGSMFKALGFHAAILHIGANDAGQGVTAAKYYDQMKQLISMIRAWQQDNSFPIIIMVEVYRTGLTDNVEKEFSRYAGVVYKIALEDSNVKIINSRKILHELGLSSSNPTVVSAWLKDNVHYTAEGAAIIATKEVSELLN